MTSDARFQVVWPEVHARHRRRRGSPWESRQLTAEKQRLISWRGGVPEDTAQSLESGSSVLGFQLSLASQ